MSQEKSLNLNYFLYFIHMATVALSSLAVKCNGYAAKETFKSINSSFPMQIDRRHNQGLLVGQGT